MPPVPVLLIADDKECDALVCYYEKDSSLVNSVLIRKLESRYKCTQLELSHHNCKYLLISILASALSRSSSPSFSSLVNYPNLIEIPIEREPL